MNDKIRCKDRVIHIKSTMKFKLLMIIGILVFAQFVPNSPHFLYAATTPPIELKSEEGTSPSVGDSFELTIERNEQEVTESIVTLSPNAIFDITSIKKMNTEVSSFNVEANMLTIEWGSEEESSIKVVVVIEGEGNIEITSSNIVGEETIMSDPIKIKVDSIAEEAIEEVESEEPTEEPEEMEVIPEEKSEPDKELEDEGDVTIADLEEDSSENQIEEEDDGEVVETSPEVAKSMEPQTDEGNRYVSSWKELREAFADTSEINRLLISPTVTETTLELLVPKEMTFETTKIGSNEVTIPLTNPDWSMKVKDTRGPGAKWQVRAKAESPLETINGHELGEDALIFVQGDKIEYLKETVLIREGDEEEITIIWGEGEGIFVRVDPMQTEIRSDTEYSTNIIWEIIDAP